MQLQPELRVTYLQSLPKPPAVRRLLRHQLPRSGPSRKVFTASLNPPHQTALDLTSYYTKLRCVLAAILGREVTFLRHSFSIIATQAGLNGKGEKKKKTLPFL